MIDRLAYASCYAFSPRGVSEIANRSRILRTRIKLAERESLRLAAERVRQFYDAGLFREFFGGDVVLVPAPASSPLAPGAVSRTALICDALLAVGLAASVSELVLRTTAIRKSAFAAPGTRPNAAEHFETLAVNRARLPETPLVVVDDVVTRGATLLAIASRLAEAFPKISVRAFALVRTESTAAIERIQDPLEGFIALRAIGETVRRP